MSSAARSNRTRFRLAALVAVHLTVPCGVMLAQDEAERFRPAPFVREIFPPAVRLDATTRVEIEGQYLDGVESFVTSHAGITLRVVEDEPAVKEEREKRRARSGGQEHSSAWDILVDASVPPGLHEVRATNAWGLSAPLALHVAASPIEASDPTKSTPVDVAVGSRVAGRVERGEVEVFTLRASESGRVVVEAWGERVDSPIDATLEVFEIGRGRVAYAEDVIASDPVLAFDAEAGRSYRIELWDYTYEDKLPYVLEISTSPRLLLAWPPLAPRADGEGTTRVYGWSLPGGEPLDPDEAHGVESLDLERLDVASSSLRALDGSLGYRPTDALSAGARLFGVKDLGESALRSSLRLLSEETANVLVRPPGGDGSASTAGPSIVVPAVVAARFDSARDVDRYRFEVRKGETLEISVESAGLGLRTDIALLVARVEPAKDDRPERLVDESYVEERPTSVPNDGDLRRVINLPTRDPRTVWTAANDGAHVLEVRNRNGRFGVASAYVLRVTRAEPDFELVALVGEATSSAGPLVLAGAREVIDVLVERRGGYEGPIRLRAEGLPAGVSAESVLVAPGDGYAPLVLRAERDVRDWTGSIRIVGTASWNETTADDGTEHERTIEREARSSFRVYGHRERRHPLQYQHSRFSDGVPLAVRSREAPFSIALDGDAAITTVPGAKFAVPVRVERHGFEGPIRVSYQGLEQKGYTNDNGERPAKKNLAKDASSESDEFTIPNRLALGEHTFLAYASSEFEFRAEEGNPKARKSKRWWSTASSPVTVRLVPPVDALRLAGSDDSPAPTSIVAALGTKVSVPIELTRPVAVEVNCDVQPEIEGDRSGLRVERVRFEKLEKRAEVEISIDLDAKLDAEPRGLRLKARVNHAGRNYDLESFAPGFLRLVEPFRAELGLGGEGAVWSVARRGSLPVGVSAKLAEGVDGKLTVSLRPVNGVEARSIELPTEDGSAATLALALGDLPEGQTELAGLELEYVLESRGRRFSTRRPVPSIAIEPAFAVAHEPTEASDRVRLRVRRHRSLVDRDDLTASVRAVGPAGVEAKGDGAWKTGEDSVVVEFEASALRKALEASPGESARVEDSGASESVREGTSNTETSRIENTEALFPLRVRLEALGGALREEYVIDRAVASADAGASAEGEDRS